MYIVNVAHMQAYSYSHKNIIVVTKTQSRAQSTDCIMLEVQQVLCIRKSIGNESDTLQLYMAAFNAHIYSYSYT